MQFDPNSYYSFNLQQNINGNGLFESFNYIPPLKSKNMNYQPMKLSTNHNINNCAISLPHQKQIINNKNVISLLNIDFQNNETKKMKKRESNRNASKRWRKKMDSYLIQLDHENEKLKEKVFSMLHKMQELKCEVNFLNDELQFFQTYMSTNLKTK